MPHDRRFLGSRGGTKICVLLDATEPAAPGTSRVQAVQHHMAAEAEIVTELGSMASIASADRRSSMICVAPVLTYS